MSALVQTLRTPALTRVMTFATDLGRWQGIAAGAVALGIGLLLRRRKADVIALGLTLIFGELALAAIKTFVGRARPDPANALTFESTASFPSGHTFVATLFYGLACFLLVRTMGRAGRFAGWAVGAVLVVTIGFSRVYLGVHWPSDVLASLAGGVVWLAAAITPLSLLDARPGSRPAILPRRPRLALVAGLAVGWAAIIVSLFVAIPLRQPHAVPVGGEMIADADVPQRLFARLPRTSEDITGNPMEPINLVFVGSAGFLEDAFRQAGWVPADPLGLRSLRREIAAVAGRAPYPEQPGTPTFWNGRPNSLTFERATEANTIRERHHIHIWNSGVDSPSGDPIWVATAHFDRGFKRSGATPIPVHAIDPDVDRQRDYVVETLRRAGGVVSAKPFSVTGSLTGKNFAGDRFFTDGTARLVILKRAGPGA